MAGKMRIKAFITFLALSTPAFATDGSDVLSAMVSNCITPLQSKTELGADLTRADSVMETKLLDGKLGRVYRTANPKVVILAHESGTTCEVMGLGIAVPEFTASLDAWLDVDTDFVIDDTANMPATGQGGASIARIMPEGDYMQAFIQTLGDAGFIGITVSRVAESEAAKAMLAK
jgi:hypothetical protein